MFKTTPTSTTTLNFNLFKFQSIIVKKQVKKVVISYFLNLGFLRLRVAQKEAKKHREIIKLLFVKNIGVV
ncbi:hypothetical protein NBO_28g0045 [Nosema bombycis CQ1]|uniref:Uncharacterized protein n=1 Tax=Nosema bombycis (strain CQ1 / CVCC 102059) TaxID=578461 RepID=R0KUC3_NOSB1|nr:hypothetical protein NBO_28g0045 [Nosema bombycis CQ1]|eukprot:EOB14406.1 hypothetical protein NBO_28g0045 [Nosema bombycis CQ1]